MTTTYPATSRQIGYIRRLLSERPNYPYTHALARLLDDGSLTLERASKAIDNLLTFPVEERPVERIIDYDPAQVPPAQTTHYIARNVPEVAAPVVERSFPACGIYTAVLGDGVHRTLRITEGTGNFEGKTIISFLSGSDNNSDYTGFAHIEAGQLRVWRKFQTATAILQALDVLCTPEGAQAAGERYALESGRCYRCNRLLTVPASIHRGLGPDCAKKV